MKGVSESLVVQLDGPASKLLRRYMSGRRFPCVHGGADPRDVASAALVYFLADTQQSTDQELRAATKRRERAEGCPVVQACPPVAVPVASGMLYSMLASALYDAGFGGNECIASARARRLTRAKRQGPSKQPSRQEGGR